MVYGDVNEWVSDELNSASLEKRIRSAFRGLARRDGFAAARDFCLELRDAGGELVLGESRKVLAEFYFGRLLARQQFFGVDGHGFLRNDRP